MNDLKTLLVILLVIMILVPSSVFAVEPRVNVKGVTNTQVNSPIQVTHINGTILWSVTNQGVLQNGIIPKAKIQSSGTFSESDIPTLSKSKISSSGVWSTDEIPALTQSHITGLVTALADKYSSTNRQTNIVNSEISSSANIDKSKISVTGAWDASEIPTLAQSKITGLTTDLAGKQDSDSDLTTIGGLTPTNDDVLQRKSGAWINRSPSQLKTDLSLTKSDVGLSNVDNTSDASKPISSATQTALDLKASTSHSHSQSDVTNLSNDLNSKFSQVSQLTGGSASLLNSNSSSKAVFKKLGDSTYITWSGNTTGIITPSLSDIPISKVTSLQSTLDAKYSASNRQTSIVNSEISTVDASKITTGTFDNARLGFKIDNLSNTCSSTDKISGIIYNNSTGDWTVTCSADQTGTSSLKVDTLSTIATDRFISAFDNSTGDWTTKIFSVNTQTATNDFQIVGIDNSTGHVTRNQFSVNTQTCSGNDKVSAINNVTGQVTCSADQTGSGGGPTVLGADVTCTQTGAYCTIFTIPLTASSGNNIDIQLIGDSNTAGAAIQTRARGDDGQILGTCVHRVYTTATAEVLDVLTVTGTPADTGETVWLPAANTPTRLTIQCSVETDASSPQNLIVDYQMEVASTGTIQKGSYYVKTP